MAFCHKLDAKANSNFVETLGGLPGGLDFCLVYPAQVNGDLGRGAGSERILHV